MPKPISAEEFDRRFDDGEDMGDYIDWTMARRGDEGIVRVDLDLPERTAAKLEAAAERRGVTREALIRLWLSEKLGQAAEKDAGTSAAA